MVEKDLLGIKEEGEEAESECRIEEEVAMLLYPPLAPPAPRTTCLAMFRKTCAIESVSGSGVVLVRVPREIWTGSCMWGVNCCNRKARSTQKTRPVSSDRAATDIDDVMGLSVLQSYPWR